MRVHGSFKLQVVAALSFLVLALTPVCSVLADLSPDRRILLAAEHLLKMQLDSGLFIYEHDFLSGADSSDNNIVRQAGATFALGEYYQHSGDKAAKRAIAKARKAFNRNAVEWKSGRLLAFEGKPGQAKAGATALAVLAVLLSTNDAGVLQSDGQLNAWLNGLLALQQQDGGFASKPGSNKQSAYSNGEIWLALATYIDRNGDEADGKLTAALERADEEFMARYRVMPDIGFFHWGMMAAAARYWSTRDSRFAEFIANQTTLFLERLRPRMSRKSNSCYSVEGLLAGLKVLKAEADYQTLVRQIRQRVDKEMEKNRALQVLPGQDRILFSRSHYLISAHLNRYAGAFLNGKYRPQIRIDATQHCLSAMIRENALAGAGNSERE